MLNSVHLFVVKLFFFFFQRQTDILEKGKWYLCCVQTATQATGILFRLQLNISASVSFIFNRNSNQKRRFLVSFNQNMTHTNLLTHTHTYTQSHKHTHTHTHAHTHNHTNTHIHSQRRVYPFALGNNKETKLWVIKWENNSLIIYKMLIIRCFRKLAKNLCFI